VTEPGTTPRVPIVYNEFGPESDPGPFPIPVGAAVEQAATAMPSASTATTAGSMSSTPRPRAAGSAFDVVNTGAGNTSC
jgi:hypothetical protein